MKYRPNEVLVAFTAGTSSSTIASAHAAVSASVQRVIPRFGLHLVAGKREEPEVGRAKQQRQPGQHTGNANANGARRQEKGRSRQHHRCRHHRVELPAALAELYVLDHAPPGNPERDE